MSIDRIGPADMPSQFGSTPQYWQFLGRSILAANAVTIPALKFGVYRYLWVTYFIVGYSGAGIARLRVGNTAIDTGLNCANSLLEGATLNNTAVSIPGFPSGVATTTGPRFVEAYIYNESARVKRMFGRSNNISVAANTAPTMCQKNGIWVNTTGPIQIIDVTNYDTLIATAVSVNSLLAGSQFSVWGRNDD
jgi:hypothetical protein